MSTIFSYIIIVMKQKSFEFAKCSWKVKKRKHLKTFWQIDIFVTKEKIQFFGNFFLQFKSPFAKKSQFWLILCSLGSWKIYNFLIIEVKGPNVGATYDRKPFVGWQFRNQAISALLTSSNLKYFMILTSWMFIKYVFMVKPIDKKNRLSMHL